MKTFTIENETNNITVHATVLDAEAVANAERFRNEIGLAKLAAQWPTARLVGHTAQRIGAVHRSGAEAVQHGQPPRTHQSLYTVP